MVKTCYGCGKELDIEFFVNDPRRISGKGALCTFCNRGKNNTRNKYNRLRVLRHYGGNPPVCACCGVGFIEFLALDHINGGGSQHRKTIKIRWWEWIIKNNFPPEFRVLCHNCNQAIGIYGYCPHHSPSLFMAEASRYDPTAPNKSFKLSQEEADHIRDLINKGVPQWKIAKDYNVSRAAICLINKRKVWAASPS